MVDDLKKGLFEFLRDNDILGAFLRAFPYGKDINECLMLRGPSKFFGYSDSFTSWMRTAQGQFFWADIDKKWRLYCKTKEW